MTLNLKYIAKMIDHSLLHPTLTDPDLLRGCELALEYDVAAVSIKPYAVSMAAELLAGSNVKVGSVVGFPHGSNHLDVKITEAEQAIADGAVELDMVINIGKVLSGDWDYVSDEIRELNAVAVQSGGILKVIFENDYLEQVEFIQQLCEISSQHEVAFVKTSTGYGFVKQAHGMYSYDGAKDADLSLMRKVCTDEIQIKAAGGVRTLDDVLRVKSLGVTRIGATATESILEEAMSRGYQ